MMRTDNYGVITPPYMSGCLLAAFCAVRKFKQSRYSHGQVTPVFGNIVIVVQSIGRCRCPWRVLFKTNYIDLAGFSVIHDHFIDAIWRNRRLVVVMNIILDAAEHGSLAVRSTTCNL